MTRVLTPPVAPPGPDSAEQNITSVRIDLRFDPEVTPGNGTEFNGGGSRFFYEVTDFDEDGIEQRAGFVAVPPGALPLIIRQAVATLIDYCDSDGVTRGIINAGTYTPDF